MRPQTVRLRLLRVGWPDLLEGGERIVKVAGAGERETAIERPLCPRRQREHRVRCRGQCGWGAERDDRLPVGPGLANQHGCHEQRRDTSRGPPSTSLKRPAAAILATSAGRRCLSFACLTPQLEPIEPVQHRQRFVVRRPTIERVVQETTRLLTFAPLERGHAVLKQLLGLALTLRQRAARPIDICARSLMRAVEEQDPRPDVDGLLILPGEIVIEAGEEKPFDRRGPVLPRRRCFARPWGVGAKRIGHNLRSAAIIQRGIYNAAVPIACIPNVSEGRRTDVVELLAASLRGTGGVSLLDYSSDASHNRSVFTMTGTPAALKHGVLALFSTAVDLIDLRQHTGQHPRIGAVDVVPFVPLGDVELHTCVQLARDTAQAVADQFDIPVYLYEAAASTPARRPLEAIRRGQFEGLARRLEDPAWTPDFGPHAPHPSAGASAIGARRPLIAYNVDLATADLAVARRIAAAIRTSNGGLPALKALGIPLTERGIVQVSMNLTDYRQTSMLDAFTAVRREAARDGVEVIESELIGLVPADAISDTIAAAVRLRDFDADRVLEQRLARAARDGEKPPA